MKHVSIDSCVIPWWTVVEEYLLGWYWYYPTCGVVNYVFKMIILEDFSRLLHESSSSEDVYTVHFGFECVFLEDFQSCTWHIFVRRGELHIFWEESSERRVVAKTWSWPSGPWLSECLTTINLERNLLEVLLYMCPYTNIYIYVLILLHIFPHTTTYVSWYYYMCPHTTWPVVLLRTSKFTDRVY